MTHRDLKPENLLVDVDMDKGDIAVVMADFGFQDCNTKERRSESFLWDTAIRCARRCIGQE